MKCNSCEKDKKHLLSSKIGWICANCTYKRNFHKLKGKGFRVFIKYNWHYLKEKAQEYL